MTSAVPTLVLGSLLFVGPPRDDESGERWIHRHAPEPHMLELGVWGGILIPSRAHEFYDPATTVHHRFRVVAPDFGLRFAYLPIRFFGMEIEGGLMPTQTESDRNSLLYAARGHFIGQLPWRVTPFLLVGGGVMGVSSGRGTSAVGKDVDASFHWGPGVKLFINRWLAVRFDFRHVVGARRGYEDGAASHFELLGGLSVTFRLAKDKGKSKSKNKNEDPDGDGFWGRDDKCPNEPGTYPEGCPAPDQDDDGVADSVDECPSEPGEIPTGCPQPDRDDDGVADSSDACPDEAGTKPEGCPADTDGDGVSDAEDDCPDKPESDNGYEDEDGCPDELPTQLRGAAGVMPGINFEVNSTRITKQSKPALDDAVRTLKQNPKYSVKIEGHTDSTGDRQHNVELSQQRADAVRDYLVEHGIESERINTVGYGPNRPKADNDTAEGRAQNRRIEFRLRQGRVKKSRKK